MSLCTSLSSNLKINATVQALYITYNTKEEQISRNEVFSSNKTFVSKKVLSGLTAAGVLGSFADEDEPIAVGEPGP